jgi:hypothetical protein
MYDYGGEGRAAGRRDGAGARSVHRPAAGVGHRAELRDEVSNLTTANRHFSSRGGTDTHLISHTCLTSIRWVFRHYGTGPGVLGRFLWITKRGTFVLSLEG